MRLSYVIHSHNRRQTLLQTLAMLHSVTPLPPAQWEIFVIDRASTDGTPDAVRAEFPKVNLLSHSATAKGTVPGQGDYVIVLDEATHPADNRTLATALSYMDINPAVGALAGRIILSDGAGRAPSLPGIVISGATCFRRSTLDRAGGFSRMSSDQAADWDLSFRIWNAGFRIERRMDILFRQEATASDQKESSPAFDLRDHLIVARRFLPAKLRRVYSEDWHLRYQALARHAGSRRAVGKALLAARFSGLRQILTRRATATPEAVEGIFGFRRQTDLIGQWARQHTVWRIVLADFSENIYATYNACRANGLQLRCIADDTPAFQGLRYRDLPIVSPDEAFEGGGIDGAIITNLNPTQIDARLRTIRRAFRGPILRLWDVPRVATHATAA